MSSSSRRLTSDVSWVQSLMSRETCQVDEWKQLTAILVCALGTAQMNDWLELFNRHDWIWKYDATMAMDRYEGQQKVRIRYDNLLHLLGDHMCHPLMDSLPLDEMRRCIAIVCTRDKESGWMLGQQIRPWNETTMLAVLTQMHRMSVHIPVSSLWIQWIGMDHIKLVEWIEEHYQSLQQVLDQMERYPQHFPYCLYHAIQHRAINCIDWIWSQMTLRNLTSPRHLQYFWHGACSQRALRVIQWMTDGKRGFFYSLWGATVERQEAFERSFHAMISCHDRQAIVELVENLLDHMVWNAWRPSCVRYPVDDYRNMALIEDEMAFRQSMIEMTHATKRRYELLSLVE